ncbi:MAG: sulfite exporter TauE/SafE family protein [Pseudomonadota bacterium]|jgi:thiol:disulfide interchange protein DsbD
MIEQLAAGQVSLLTVWLLGVSMGLTACTVTCLPFLGTWMLGRGSGQHEGLVHTAVFLAGRMTTYTLLGALAGGTGLGLAKTLGGGWGNALIGAASILAGAWLLPRALRKGCGSGEQAPAQSVVRIHHRPGRRDGDGLPPLFMGAALSLTPCTPLASLLALAANGGGIAQGAGYGLAFGLGTAVTPILVLAPLAGQLGLALRDGRVWLGRWITWGAALVLIVLGLRRLQLL